MKTQNNQTAPFGNYKLFSPLKVGPYHLTHRVVLAPMTRLRSEANDAPSEMMMKFYEQRASEGGLLIAEAAAISYEGRSYLGAPGMYLQEHIPAWQKLVEGVHNKGAYIFAQLFHGGRQSHFELSGTQPVTASVLPFDSVAFTKDGFVPVTQHRALEVSEIAAIVENFRKSAEIALAAGLDGVELHGANGYLPDQFLQDGSNKRTDIYGGSIENRARLMLELTNALISVFGANRVGVRISPSGEWGGVYDSDPQATFGYLAKELDKLGLAYIHVIEPRIKGDDTLHEGQAAVAAATIRQSFKGTIVAAGGFDREQAEAIINNGDADVVAFGRHFSSNPDLPERLKNGYPLTPYVRAAFWGGSEKNYNDFNNYSVTVKNTDRVLN
jgi:N-ethylmaleimide reductase